MTNILVPSPNNGFAMPFFYGAIRSCWAYFAVDKQTADGLLSNSTGGDTGMEATLFDHPSGKTALACLNFMHYPSMGDDFGSFTTELEVNIVGNPKAKSKSIPALSVQEFLYGQEQTKIVGYYRLHVVADSTVAIQAGRSVFGEYKYFGMFDYDVPTYNLMLAQSTPSATLDWTFSPHIDGGDVYEDITSVEPNFTLKIEMSKMQPSVQSSQTALTDYSMWSKFSADQVDPTKTPVPPVGKELNGSRRNYLAALITYWIDKNSAEYLTLTYGSNSNDLGITKHLKALLGETPLPVAAASVRSEPAVIESPPFYANKI